MYIGPCPSPGGIFFSARADEPRKELNKSVPQTNEIKLNFNNFFTTKPP